jgi:hypothetical protein
MENDESELLCGPCSVSRKNTKSVSWCMECEEGLKTRTIPNWLAIANRGYYFVNILSWCLSCSLRRGHI